VSVSIEALLNHPPLRARRAGEQAPCSKEVKEFRSAPKSSKKRLEQLNKTRLLNRPQRRPLRGVPVRRIDHVNLLASDVTPT